MTARREFLKIIPLAGAAAALPGLANAQQTPALAETDKMAIAMGFRLRTEGVDQGRYPKHTNEQSCVHCLHFPAVGGDSGRCDLFGKLVPKGGWCSGFSRRP